MIVGVHDDGTTTARWLDENNTYSWLRTFERLPCETYAMLRNPGEERGEPTLLRNLNYVFRKEPFPDWADQIVSLNPQVLFLNVAYYFEVAPTLKALRERLPNMTVGTRIHHDVDYLRHKAGFLDVIGLSDFWIAPTQKQRQELTAMGYSGGIASLPFGVRLDEFDGSRDWASRDITLLSAANWHPARNRKITLSVIKSLNRRGYSSDNLLGFSRPELADMLGRAKFFFLSSLTEASGSRILIEAIASGCYPIVLSECRTAVGLLEELGIGTSVRSGLRLIMPQRKVGRRFGARRRIRKALLDVIRNTDRGPEPVPDLGPYDFEFEIESLRRILERYVAP